MPIGVLAETTLLATIGDQEEPDSTDPALGDKPAFQIFFNERGRGVAYIAKTAGGVHVVHNGMGGRPYEKFFNLSMSPDGQRIAYSVLSKDGMQRLVLDRREGQSFDDIGRIIFSPDGKHVAYKVIEKEKLYVVVDDNISNGYSTYNGNPVFSADSTKVAYAEGVDGDRRPRLVISDLMFRKYVIKEASGDLMVVNDARTRIATVNIIQNKQRVIEFSFDQPDVVKEGPLYDTISQPTFGSDGVSVSYAAVRGKTRLLVLNGREVPLPDDPMVAMPVVARDQRGAAAIMANVEVMLAPQALYYDGKTGKQYNEISHLVHTRDGSRHAYGAMKGQHWLVVVNGKEGPMFDIIVSPMFSPDGKRLVYRVRKDGKRFVVVADATGRILRRHPAYEMVFETVFTDDGTSIAYGVKDGQKLIWKVEKLLN